MPLYAYIAIGLILLMLFAAGVVYFQVKKAIREEEENEKD